MNHLSNRNGYILLISVLVIGVMASASAIAILLLGLGIERNAYSMQISTQAYANAWSCAEYAILELQADIDYQGNEEREILYGYDDKQGGISYDTTNCLIYPINGADNEDRVICTEGTFGNFTTRRLEIHIDRVRPSTAIDSWEEVSRILNCEPYTGPPHAECGNGTLQTGYGEECDDGNNWNNDGCSSICLNEVCGDGTKQTNEECDDYNTQDGDGCTSLCEEEICGDGTLHASEQCDDSNIISGDGCSAACRNEECGDGYLDPNGPDNIGGNSDDESCDDGNTNNGDGCDSTCLIETSADPSPSDYIVYWELDETDPNADVANETGPGYDGTPEEGVGVTTSDKAPLNISNVASRLFDGIDDRVYINDDSHLFPDEMTISFWTKNDVEPAQFDAIMCKTDKPTWSKGWGFFYNSPTQVAFFIQQWDDNIVYADINPIVWNHIAATYDGSTMKIYVNGVEGTSDTYSGPLNKGRKLYFGRCGSDDTANNFNTDGKIDEVRIYDRVLDSGEITALASGN